MRIASFLALLLLFSTDSYGAQKVSGHPLLKPYEGVSTFSGKRFEYAEHQMIIGFDFDKQLPISKTVAGTLTRLTHANPEQRSIHEIFTNYRQAFEQAGFQAIWSCKGDGDCFTGTTRNTYKQMNGFNAMNGGESQYAVGQLTNQQGKQVYVAFGVGRRNTAIDIIESNEMQTHKVTVTPDYLAEQLKRNGFVKIDGLHFAHDSDELLEESQPSLEALVGLLTQRTELALYIVGHTDMTGDEKYNVNLSKRRAKSVMNSLVNQYGIEPSRLSAKGVGPYAPEANNQSAQGRAVNRRIEIVKKGA